jgi:hypothetical protein
METITKEQFDSLKVGDTLKNENYTLLIEAKYANTIMVLLNEHDSAFLSFKFIQGEGYSINQPIQNNCGFPYGNYSDREVIVKVSDKSIEHCTKDPVYMRLMNVSKSGFQDYNCDCRYWQYAVLVSNNVNLVK